MAKFRSDIIGLGKQQYVIRQLTDKILDIINRLIDTFGYFNNKFRGEKNGFYAGQTGINRRFGE